MSAIKAYATIKKSIITIIHNKENNLLIRTFNPYQIIETLYIRI